MAYIDKLEVSRRALGSSKSRRKAPPIEHSRSKLLANIEEQIAARKAQDCGQTVGTATTARAENRDSPPQALVER